MFGGMWDASRPLPVTPEQRFTLEAWVVARNTPQKVVFRSQIVLMAATGAPNHRIARTLNTSRPTVLLWRQRFRAGGPVALTEEAPGRGRKPRLTAARVQEKVE